MPREKAIKVLSHGASLPVILESNQALTMQGYLFELFQQEQIE